MGPVEYEALAEQVDGIMSAVVVGVPDLVKGEVPVVLIVPGWDSADREALAEAARSKILGAMGKAMSRAAIVVVEALPVTRSGTVHRRAVRAWLLGTDPGDLSTLDSTESQAAISAAREQLVTQM